MLDLPIIKFSLWMQMTSLFRFFFRIGKRRKIFSLSYRKPFAPVSLACLVLLHPGLNGGEKQHNSWVTSENSCHVWSENRIQSLWRNWLLWIPHILLLPCKTSSISFGSASGHVVLMGTVATDGPFCLCYLV